MSLPIDPEQLTREDIGERSVTLNMGHDEAVEHVRQTFEAAGFGMPVEFSPSELLREKIDADRDPYYVLGACNPEMADKALEVTREIGALFPCNVVVWEVEPGVQQVHHVSIMKIARLNGIAPDNDDWEEVVDGTRRMVEEAFDDLETTDDAGGGEKPRGRQGGKQEGSGGSPQ
ncbi:DUF302 domain-containing protein [Halalkalicoccus tibetensis]|uniref:DUF302 domain-containing protein n=1 Tax=Halalkalicoccus tibetensis TaxID=175632 RepID=A0ABD5V0N2_9EURY